MIRVLYQTSDGMLQTNLKPEDISRVLQDDSGLLWVDFVQEPPQTCEPIMREAFGFHPLAIDDALAESHVPKVDDWGSYLYLVLHEVLFDPDGDEPLSTLELDLFVGRHYLVTHQSRPNTAVSRVWAACQRDSRYLDKGVGHLLYRLADELVADYMPVLDSIDGVIDTIEDRLFENPAPILLEQIFTLKRALLYLRRIIAPQREVLNRLARGDYSVIAAEERVFFRDVYDHLVRLYDISESLRDLVGGVLDTYLSVINNRMNEVMKTLTIITTLFMPLAFVTGFFGMNFFEPVTRLVIWTDRPVFLLTLLIMMLTPVGMFLWMRRRAWM